MTQSPYFILCVDDEADFLEVVAEHVAGCGYQVLRASSPLQAQELVKKHQKHLLCIISDYEMPAMNGFDFCQSVIATAKDVPFIILSGVVSRDMALRAVDLGIVALLSKPIDPLVLQTTIDLKTKSYRQTLDEKAILEKLFISESQDLALEIEPLLLALDDEPHNGDLLNSLFRLVHTIKGGSGVLDLPEITAFLHSFEDLLAKIKQGLTATQPVVTVLLAAFDVMRRTIHELSLGQGVAVNYGPILGQLKQAASGKNEAPGDQVQQAAGAVGAAATSDSSAKTNGIMVPTPMLDEFMHLAGEITVIRNMVNKLVRVIERRTPGDADVTLLGELLDEMHKINSNMQNRIVDLKKIQVSTVFSKLPRTVRDLSKQLSKNVHLELSGGSVRVDTTIAGALSNSLIHMVRNCVDHGIESPGQRTSAGKTEDGRIRLSCREDKDYIVVTIEDNGRGIDPERIKAKLIEAGRIPSEQIARMTKQELFQQIFEPGFSTAATVTDVSGRGVGMDMVRSSITKLKGRIEIISTLGKGTTFILMLPIPRSVVIISSLIVEALGHFFAIPQDQIVRLIRLEGGRSHRELAVLPGGALMLRYEGGLLPLVELAPLLGLTPNGAVGSASHAEDATSDLCVLVLRSETATFGLVVSGVHDTEDAVMKSLHKCVDTAGIFRGATFMADGSVGLILDVEGLAKVSRVALEPSTEAVAVKAAETGIVGEATQDYLTFTLDAPGSYAIPLGDVYRLEEFPAPAIKSYGHQRGLIYRGGIMPLIDLAGWLYPNERPAAVEVKDASEALIRVIIAQRGQRFFAFLVRDISEIVTTASQLDQELARAEGTSGVLLIGDHPTTVIDVQKILGPATDSPPVAVLPGPAPGSTAGQAPTSAGVNQATSSVVEAVPVAAPVAGPEAGVQGWALF